MAAAQFPECVEYVSCLFEDESGICPCHRPGGLNTSKDLLKFEQFLTRMVSELVTDRDKHISKILHRLESERDHQERIWYRTWWLMDRWSKIKYQSRVATAAT